jgi:glycosyltransferase involved in cell wall biosynthesis
MKISLVCTSLGARLSEVRRLLESIDTGAADVQFILVDQSPDGILRPILEAYANRFETIYAQSERGASRGRNAGLARATGELIAFPDDDCWYTPDTIANVVRAFEANDALAGLSGCWVDEDGAPSGMPWPTARQAITRDSAWRSAIAFTMFFRARAVRGIAFDANVGVGAGTLVGAGEETLYLLHVLATGGAVVYEPSIRVHHPWKGVGAIPFRKAYSYAIGFGYVATKTHYPASFLLPRLVIPWARFIASGLRADAAAAKYHLACGLGRIRGTALARFSDPEPAPLS